MWPFPIALMMEMKSCPISSGHQGSSLDGFGMSVRLTTQEGEHLRVTAIPVAGTAKHRCCETCRKGYGLHIIWGMSLWQGCSQSPVMAAQKWSLLHSSLDVCLHPQIIPRSSDLENTGNLHVFQQRFDSGCSFFKSFFSLSFPSYLATSPTGTTLMQENRLDDILKAGKVRPEAILSQATCKPAAGTRAVTRSQVTVTYIFLWTARHKWQVWGKAQLHEPGESGGRNRIKGKGVEQKRILFCEEITNKAGTWIFLFQAKKNQEQNWTFPSTEEE